MIGMREDGLLFCKITNRTGRYATTAMHVWKGWTEEPMRSLLVETPTMRHIIGVILSSSDNIMSPRYDKYVITMAVMERKAFSLKLAHR